MEIDIKYKTILLKVIELLIFPLLILYLEILIHLYMHNNMHYFPIYLLFSLSFGCLLTAITSIFNLKIKNILIKVLSGLITLVYGVELVAKTILQSYYPLSTLKVAAGNRLTDYTDVIIENLLSMIPVLIFLILPFVLIMIFSKSFIVWGEYKWRFTSIFIAAFIFLHVIAYGVINLPWRGDLTPKMLYSTDTNIDDQVEQLGLLTMLRLDIKHMIFPVEHNLNNDFSLIEELKDNFSKIEFPTVDTSPNVMDVDLKAIAESTSNSNVEWLANYFNSLTPTNKNEYTGMFEGYNVIQFVMEGFSGYAIDPELTPTLYKLANEGFVFNNYYTALHYTSTSNGECQTLLGLYPKNGNPITMKRTGDLGTNLYFSLAQQLNRLGYEVYGYHNNQDMYGRYLSHTNLGYTWKQYVAGRNNDEDTLTCEENAYGTDRLWPQRDKYMIEASIDDYINSDDPFHVYYLTVSGHAGYDWNRVASQYQDLLIDYPYSEKTKAYIASAVIEVDRALEYLIERLDEAGKLDNTLIIATGDHIPYGDVDILEELTGKTFGTSEALRAINESAIDFDVYKNTLIMWSSSMEEPIEVDKVACQVDILPTVSNLLGLEYDSRMLAGTDLLSTSEGLVIFSSRSWKSDIGFYNRFNQTFTLNDDINMTEDELNQYVEAMKQLVDYKLNSTAYIVESDFYNILFPKEE